MSTPDGAREASAGEYSADEDDQLQPEDTLVDRGVDDVLDEGYSPPERPYGRGSFGSTPESLDQLLAEEEPDPAMQMYDPFDRRQMAAELASDCALGVPEAIQIGDPQSLVLGQKPRRNRLRRSTDRCIAVQSAVDEQTPSVAPSFPGLGVDSDLTAGFPVLGLIPT